ncbi:MAG: hypothetical protein WKF66_02100 [Pedobacter sp.]
MGEIHMGQLLERAVRRTGLNITDLAIGLGVNRRTIYSWFTMEVIDESIMHRISDIIKHDFSSGKRTAIVVQLKNEESSPSGDDAYWKDKYIKFLERYSELIKDK